MPRLIITSTLDGDGKSVVAAGAASMLRASGATVRAVRLDDGQSAEADAAQLARLQGVRGGPAVDAGDVQDDADWIVVEAGAKSAAAVRRDGDRLLLVARSGEADDDTLARAISEHAPDGVVVTCVPERGEPVVRERVSSLGGALFAAIPLDRHLAAPVVRQIADAVDGELSGHESLFGEASRDLVVGPVSAHEGMDYFRKYPDKTVVSRHDRIDIALGALDYEPLCLVLCGGEPTLPYVAQRAESESFALIVTSQSTVEAVNAVGPLYGSAPFSGERKLAAAVALVGESTPDDALAFA